LVERLTPSKKGLEKPKQLFSKSISTFTKIALFIYIAYFAVKLSAEYWYSSMPTGNLLALYYQNFPPSIAALLFSGLVIVLSFVGRRNLALVAAALAFLSYLAEMNLDGSGYRTYNLQWVIENLFNMREEEPILLLWNISNILLPLATLSFALGRPEARKLFSSAEKARKKQD
jgi:hypothetical protein